MIEMAMGKKNMFDIFRMKSQFSNSVKNKIDTFFEGRIDQDQTIAGVDRLFFIITYFFNWDIPTEYIFCGEFFLK